MQTDLLIIGHRAGGDPVDEEQNFEPCPICGQRFDMRDLAQVLHHAEPVHGPVPERVTRRLVQRGQRRRARAGH